MSKSLQSKLISRATTKNIEDIIRIKQQTYKKCQGNSQFIRSKFDIDYEPKFRIIKPKLALNLHQIKQKKEEEKAHATELLSLSLKAQQEVKMGKKLIIDWNKKDNFRSTRFPSFDSHSQKWKRIYTQPIQSNICEKLTKRKVSEPSTKIFQRVAQKQITAKNEYLRNLLNQSSVNTKISLSRKKKKSYIDTNSVSMLTDSKNSSCLISNTQSEDKDPHFNYSIIEQVQEKNKQFFQTNQTKIKEAINYQKFMSEPIKEDKFSLPKKNDLDYYHQRILCKSKLTLLKSELAKKFKQIKEGFLDEPGNRKLS